MTRRHRTLRVLASLMILLTLTVSANNQTGISVSGNPAGSDVMFSQTREASRVAGSGNNPPSRLAGSEGSHRILYLSNVTTLPSVAERMAELVDAETMRSIVSYLSGFDNRYTGTEGSLHTISYIHGFLRLNCSMQNVFFDNFTFNDRGLLVEASSVIAKISAPKQTDETILVTAHHDSIGYQYPLNIYNTGARGADDDASGVGTLLETARILSLFKDYLGYNILFIVFAAEEGNKTLNPDFMCQGSTHWVSAGHPGVARLDDIVAAVDLDGVAYKNGGPIGIYHHSSGSAVASNMSSVASLLNVPVKDEGEPRRDSYLKPIRCRTEDTFDRAQIPAVTLSNHYANPFTHTNLDTFSQLDFNSACNFTKVVISYIYLTGGTPPKCVETYTASWSTPIGHKGQFELNEFNYLAVNFNPSIMNGFDLIVLDPSINGINKDRLLQTISACGREGRKLPIVTLGKANLDILNVLNLTGAECIEQDSSNSDLIAHVGSSIAEASAHPVYNWPDNVILTPENSTHLSYTVIRKKPSDNTYYLFRNDANTNPLLLPLAFTPSLSKLWSWLAVLHDDNWNCGPVALIGVDNGSSITDIARGIAENMFCWLINGSRTVTSVRLSDKNPLVGDRIKVTVAVRNSLTWEANSSIPVSLRVTSPSGRLLLGENCTTDENGVAESSSLLVKEIGEHKSTVTTNLGRPGATRTITSFNSIPRIIISYEDDRVSVTQGESIRILLNLTYAPAQSEDLILEVRGEPLSSNLSLVETLKHGYNNMTLAITAKETIRAGEYDLSLAAMPRTMEYVACNQSLKVLITPAYQLSIIEAPKTIDQLSSAQLLLQIKSYRSIPVQCSLRIDSHRITLTGKASISISSGETKQIALSVEETSSSPYSWGEGEIKVTVVKNGVAVAQSRPVAIFVSLSATNLALGYVLPAVLPIAFFIEQSRRKRAQLAALGAFIGGYTFFAIGLMIYQSLYMIVPLSMLIVGCYVGTMVMEHVYDIPLPKGYNWFVPSRVYDVTGDHDTRGRKTGKLLPFSPVPEFCFLGISRLKDLYNMKKYSEVVPAAYSMVVDMLSDLHASSIDTAPTEIKETINLNRKNSDRRALIRLLKQLKRKHVLVPSESGLRKLEELYQEYTELFNSGTLGNLSQTMIGRMAEDSIEIVASIIMGSNKDEQAPKCRQR